MTPGIYRGTVRHRRFETARHEFTYELFMVLLDVDRIDELMRISPLLSRNRFNWASFYDGDHFGDPRRSLRERLRLDAVEQGIELPDGPILLLTHLRYLGYVFNPISLFYCFTREGELKVIVAEVNSTFGERHNYWLSEHNRESSEAGAYRCVKRMHVSPFLPMELEYRFNLTSPEDRLAVHIAAAKDGRTCLDATLTLRREAWSASALHRTLLSFPWMTAKVIGAIHWEALRLFAKRVSIFPHPRRHRNTV